MLNPIGAIPRGLSWGRSGLPSEQNVSRNIREGLSLLSRESLALAPTISGTVRERLLRVWGPSGLTELESLGSEMDPEILFPSLLQLAGRHLDRSPELSLLILNHVERLAGEGHAAWATRARQEREAISGTGGGGRRIEYLARHFAREATAPASLAGMAAAGLVFQVSRTYFLSRLLAAPSGTAFSGGVGARLLAASGATVLEVPAFVATAHGVNGLLGNRPHANSWGSELAHTALTLGGLRLFGAAGHGLSRWAGDGRLARALILPTATYAGILSGNIFAGRLGLSPTRSGDALLIDSFATLLQFSVAGRLSHQIMGEGFNRLQRELIQRAAGLSRPFPRSGPLSEFAFALPGIGRSRPTASRNPWILMMEGKGEATSPAPRRNKLPMAETLRYLEEILAVRDRAASEGNPVSLADLFRRELRERQWPRRIWAPLRWAVHYRQIFESSQILQGNLISRALAKPARLIQRLVDFRQGLTDEFHGQTHSLPTLIKALTFGGRISLERFRSFWERAHHFDLYHRNSWFRTQLGRDDFSSGEALFSRLQEFRRDHPQGSGEPYMLSTLVQASQYHPRFPQARFHRWLQEAAALDRIQELPLADLGLEAASLEKMNREELFLHLLQVRGRVAEQGERSLGAGTLLLGLYLQGMRRIQDAEINPSVVNEVYNLDRAMARWGEWAGHYRNLSHLPFRVGRDETSRIHYARRHFLRPDGTSYKTNTLHNFVRAGIFIWEHREALGLPDPAVLPSAIVIVEEQPAIDQALARAKRLDPSALNSFFLHLLQLRRMHWVSAPGENAVPPSLRIMAERWGRLQGKPISRTTVVMAAQLDVALERWGQWAIHYQVFSEVPKNYQPFSRSEYAKTHLSLRNGGELSDTSASSYVRWGAFLWEHREVLGLPESTVEPPNLITPMDIELTIFRALQERSAELMLLTPRRAHSGRTREFFEAMIRVQRELTQGFRRRGMEASVPLSSLTRHWLAMNDIRKEILFQYAEVLDEILTHWENYSLHLGVLDQIKERWQQDYVRETFPELARNLIPRFCEMGTWVWKKHATLGLALPPFENALIRGLNPRLITWTREGSERMNLPRPGLGRPSRQQAAQVLEEFMKLRVGLEKRWGEREAASFPEPRLSDLYEWVTFFSRKNLVPYRETLQRADEILRNRDWWAAHATRFHDMEDVPAIRYLREYLNEEAPELLRKIEVARVLHEIGGLTPSSEGPI